MGETGSAAQHRGQAAHQREADRPGSETVGEQFHARRLAPGEAHQSWFHQLASGPSSLGTVSKPHGVYSSNFACLSLSLCSTTPPWATSSLGTLGALLFRAGQHEEALKKLQESIKLHSSDGSAPTSNFLLHSSGGNALTWLFLAMTQHRLGHADEARQALDRAMAAAAKSPSSFWHMRLQWQLLHREAESLILAPPSKNRAKSRWNAKFDGERTDRCVAIV
jgi:tetratricopeptide (TPR) repeat protein